MDYIPRSVESALRDALKRRRSVLLLGPRQTGKTPLAQAMKPDLAFNLIRPDVRHRFERAPAALEAEILGIAKAAGPATPPLVLLDEVQRVPELIKTGLKWIGSCPAATSSFQSRSNGPICPMPQTRVISGRF